MGERAGERDTPTPAQQAKEAYIALATQIARDPLDTVAALREGYDTFTAQCFSLPEDAQVASRELGGVECLSVTAAGAGGSMALIHLHGGGYVIGSPFGYRAFAERLSAGTGAEVILPRYRLAPEHGPLDPVDDAVAVYRAVLAGGRTAADVVISGDSAGGGLALSTLIALRDAGDPLPAAGVALSPWADASLSAASVTENAETDVIVPPAFLSTLALLRLGPSGDRRDPLVSPAFADWHGIPPLLLFASTTETLRDDAVTVRDRAQDHGVNVQLELYEAMVHVWPFFSEWLPEGRQAIEQIAAFVHACTSPPLSAS